MGGAEDAPRRLLEAANDEPENLGSPTSSLF